MNWWFERVENEYWIYESCLIIIKIIDDYEWTWKAEASWIHFIDIDEDILGDLFTREETS